MLPHDLIDQLEAAFKDKMAELKEKLKDKAQEELTELGYKVDALVLKIDSFCDDWIENRMLDIDTLTPTVDPLTPPPEVVEPEVDPTPPEKQPK